jgi:uncharacterized membrane-anchored protein
MGGLPDINARYWLLLLAASVCGTSLGDFASQSLGLGFVGGVLPFALLFVAMAAASGRFASTGEAFYWLAIIIARAGATDIADFGTHQLHLSPPALLAALLTALVLTLAAGARLGQSTLAVKSAAQGRRSARPIPNATYWAAMIVASAFGTIGGDFLADDLGFGIGRATLVTLAVALGAAGAFTSRSRLSKAGYWGVVLVIRAAATNLGDFMAGDEGLRLGFASSGAVMLVLIALLTLPHRTQGAAGTNQA